MGAILQGHLIIINALSGCGETCTDVLLLLSTVFSENQEILDPSNQLWNQHPLYTERHWSPHRVYGVLDPNRVGQGLGTLLTQYLQKVYTALVLTTMGLFQQIMMTTQLKF